MNLTKIDDITKRHPWILNLVSWIVYGGLASILSFCTQIRDIPEDLKNMRKDLSTLTHNLRDNTRDGVSIIVGVNTKDLYDNTAYVYFDNRLGLRQGDSIYLANLSDTAFNPSIKVIIKKEIIKNESDNSVAQLFISQEAAIRLGFKDYKKLGVIELKHKRVANFN